MTLLLCFAFSALLCPQGHDTAGEEYEENQTKINKYTSHNPLPNYTSLPRTVCLSDFTA